MAKITTLGDSVQIKTTITLNELVKVKRYEPEALTIRDEDGNPVFTVSYGDASLSAYGICFSSTDAEDNMFLTLVNPVQDHSDKEAEKQAILEEFAPIIAKLNVLEVNIMGIVKELDVIESSVAESIEVNA